MNKVLKELKAKIERLEEKIKYVNHKEDKAYIKRETEYDFPNIIKKVIVIYPNKTNERIEKIIIYEEDTQYCVEPINFNIIKETDNNIVIAQRYLNLDGNEKLIKIDKDTGIMEFFYLDEIEELNSFIKKETKTKKEK